MKAFLSFLNHFSGSRFDRYYSGVVGSGSGYPTADEARRDLNRYHRTVDSLGLRSW